MSAVGFVNVTDDYFDYLLESVFNLSSLSDYELTQATKELSGVIHHDKFLDFSKSELSKNIYGSNFQKFLIIVENFKRANFEELKEMKPKNQTEIFVETLENKVLNIVKGMRADRDFSQWNASVVECIDNDELLVAGLKNEAVEMLVNIAKSYAVYKFEDENKTVRGLCAAYDDGEIARLIENRVLVLINSNKRKIEHYKCSKVRNIRGEETDTFSLISALELENVSFEEMSNVLRNAIAPIIDVYKARLAVDFMAVKNFEKYKLKSDKSNLFDDRELSYLNELGFDAVISYVDQGFLKKALFDLIRRRKMFDAKMIGGTSKKVLGYVDVERV